MKNSMAKDMSGRYGDYFIVGEHKERVAKTILYWVMSTLESIFWGLERPAILSIDLYASKEKIFFLFRHPTGKEYEFVYYFTHDCSDGKLPKILQKFVEIFNNYDYPLSNIIASPIFHADYYGVNNNKKKYIGYEYIHIYVDMLPRENHGRH